MEKINKLISLGFYALFFFTPLILFQKTSEIFEFNKLVFVYFMTVIIIALWSFKMILRGKLIFKRTLLDLPLLIFLFSQFLSTIFSIDPRTSLLGYYSRFNGGFLSIVCFSLLYWALVSNLGKKEVKRSILVILFSTVLTSIWAVFEHYGRSFSCFIFPEFGTFDVSCWVQDVKNRVFSSFGQPNWLAAWLVGVIPLTLNLSYARKLFRNKALLTLVSLSLTALFMAALIFTKSRSGIVAFVFSITIYWLIILFRGLRTGGGLNFLKRFSIFLSLVLIITAFFGSPWTPSVFDMNRSSTVNNPPPSEGPALETGGTESGKIRQIVWKGAIDIWKNYPVFGSGVETFAYSYYQFRPVEHNFVSEWDYLYNKAHNEFLNYAATTGTIGILSYIVFLTSCALMILGVKKGNELSPGNFVKTIQKVFLKKDKSNLKPALLAGFVGISVTNFFGFSTVAVNLLMFLFPALAIGFNKMNSEELKSSDRNYSKPGLLGLGFLVLFLLANITRYWNTDRLYALGRSQNEIGNYDMARKYISELIKRSPNEPVYWDELADNSMYLTIKSTENGNTDTAISLANSSYNESMRAIKLSPANVNLKRKASSRLITLAGIDGKYGQSARSILEDAVKLAPTDPKIFYNLSYTYLKLGSYEQAIPAMAKAVELKPDYEKARYSLALMYIDINDKESAKKELNYILEKNPTFTDARKELDELSK